MNPTLTSAEHPAGTAIRFAANRRLLSIVFQFSLLLGLGACAPMAPSPGTAPTPNDGAEAASSATAQGTDSDGAHYPNHDLDASILMRMLGAEILAQRGVPQEAFITEYNLAKEIGDARLARRATEFALMAHQTYGALQGAKLWLQLAPESEEARGTLLTILIAAGRLDDAEPVLAQALTLSPTKDLAFQQIQQSLARAPNRKDALAMLQRLAAPYPNMPSAHLAIAQAAYAAGETDVAVSEAKIAANLDANDENAPILAAQYSQVKDPAGAAAILEGFLRHHPKSAPVRMAYARYLVGQKRYEDSAAQFRLILEQHPKDPETLYALGLLAYQADRLGEAEEYFHHFIAVREAEPSPDDADDNGDGEGAAVPSSRSANAGYLYLAQIAEDQKNYPKALEALSNITDGNEYLTAQLQHAAILARMGKLDEARKELHELPVESQREKVQVILTEAQLLTDAKRGDEGLSIISAGLAEYPDDADLLYDQGMTAERLDKLDLMETSLRTLIKLHPDNAQAYNALGYSWADRNLHLNEAHDLIEKALVLDPDDASIIDSLGWVEYRLGDTQQSLENLMRAYNLRGDAEIAVHIGEVLWVAGKHEDAQRYWKEAEHKDPGNQVLHDTLDRFNVKIGER